MFKKERFEYQFNIMTEEQQIQLLEQLEKENKNLGTNNKYDKEFFNIIVNELLEVTTIIASLFGIVNK